MWSQWIQEDIWNHISSIQSNGLEDIIKAEGYSSAGNLKVFI
jgi:poly(3-hydroxyalkanoate) synthetase